VQQKHVPDYDLFSLVHQQSIAFTPGAIPVVTGTHALTQRLLMAHSIACSFAKRLVLPLQPAATLSMILLTL
jgi:hypothetical protein